MSYSVILIIKLNFNYLKNKEWKMKFEKTVRMLIEELKSEM